MSNIKKEIEDTLDSLYESGVHSNRCIEIQMTISPEKGKEIKRLVAEKYGDLGMNIYFEEQLVKPFFDKLDWKEVTDGRNGR